MPLVVVVLAAAVGGRGPALLAAVVGGGGTVLVALASPGAELRGELLAATAYVLGVAASILLTERLRRARGAAEAQARRLAEVVEDRDRALAREARSRQLAERRARILDAMQEVSATVTAPTLPPAVAERLLDIAVGTLDAATAAVALIDDDGATLRMAATRGYPPGIAARYATIPLDASLWFARVAQTGTPVWLDDGAARGAELPPDIAAEMGEVGGVAGVPLQARGTTYGVIAMGMPSGRSITADDRAFIGLVARKIGQALDRGRLEEERRRAARAEQERTSQLRAVLETMEDGIAVLAGSRIVVRNAALDRVAGAGARDAEDLARALGIATGGDDPGLVAREVGLAGPGGSQRWLELRVYAIDGADEDAETLLVVRDVTAAREAVAVRDAFVGMLSHELRTPIAIILASAGILRRRVSGDPSTIDLVDDLVAESERMNRLIDDLLVLSMPDAAPVSHPEPVLVRHVVDRVVAGIARRHPDARLVVEAPPGLAPASGDPTLLEQVLRNLVGNALKYAGPAPTVRISARTVDGRLELAVEDDGPGVPEEEREAVFDIFFRSRSTVGRAGGAGIGLFVCRRLIEAMGGRIWVTDGDGGGARFVFQVPTYAMAPGDAADADERREVGGPE